MALGTKWLVIKPSELRACLYCILFYCRKELEESGEELIRIKECYVQLSEESRSLEEKLKEQFEKEKQLLLSEASLTYVHWKITLTVHTNSHRKCALL